MKKNFKLGQSNELVCDGNTYDLHNLYDCRGIFISKSKRRCRLLFEPISEYGSRMPSICLTFCDVDYLELSQNLEVNVVIGLDEIGYIDFDRRDDSWLMNEHQATGADHFFFRFDAGEFLRIHCKVATLDKAISTELDF